MEKQKRLSIALSNLDINSYRAFQNIVPQATAIQQIRTRPTTNIATLDCTNSGPFRQSETRFKWQTDRCENAKPLLCGKLKTYNGKQRESENWNGFRTVTEDVETKAFKLHR